MFKRCLVYMTITFALVAIYHRRLPVLNCWNPVPHLHLIRFVALNTALEQATVNGTMVYNGMKCRQQCIVPFIIIAFPCEIWRSLQQPSLLLAAPSSALSL